MQAGVTKLLNSIAEGIIWKLKTELESGILEALIMERL